MRTLFISILLITFLLNVKAATLKGRILDVANGEAVTGAVITIEELKAIKDIAGLDGTYLLKDLPTGSYHLRIHATGLKPHSEVVIINDEQILTLNVRMESDIIQNREVTVLSKKDGSSDNHARSMERNADQVMNIISGRAIQVSPDVTVANVVQRVSGISIERNHNGDGQYAIVRGMDKRYNYTLVNGVKIPSPDNKYRYVPLDIFPSDLLDRLEVYKSLTPAMEGDAIGGVVNMVMKDAPAGMLFNANLGTGYNELFMNRDFMSYDFRDINKKSPYELNGNGYNATMTDFPTAVYRYRNAPPVPNIIGGIALGNRFLNNKLGVILAANYQRTFRGSNSSFFDIDKVDTLRGVTLTQYNQREYSEQQNRTGIHAKIDYKPNSRTKFQWYNAYVNLKNIQIRDERGMQLTIGGYDPEKGNATMEYQTRSRLTNQSIYTSTLQAEYYLNEQLKVDGSAVYSNAKQAIPDNTSVDLTGTREGFVEKKNYVGDGSRRWEHNSDRDIAGYLNLTYNNTIQNVPVEWKIGGLYRNKQRSNFYNSYTFRPANLKTEYGVDFTEYSEIEWTLQNPRGSVGSALSYDASEQIGAGFLQFKSVTQKLEMTGGLRAENTVQGYEMQFPLGQDRPTGKQQYLDLLPSLHFKYKFLRNTNIRLSYFRSINRPGFFEIVPYKIVNEEYQERGNPDLRHAVADNFDLRYELFPKAGEQFMLGLFYKHIKDPIEYTLQRDPVRGQDIFYSPGNFGNAVNYGLEVDVIKYVKKFGIKANYTYTHSSITTPKSKRIRNEQGDLETISVDQTRALYGQAAHIANLALLFKDAKNGWDVQLAGNYTGNRIVTVSQFIDNDFWQKGFTQLDFSLEKTFKNGKWTVFLKGNNLLNTPMEYYMKTAYNNMDAIPEQDKASGETLIRKDFYQRTYLFGVRWKLY